MNQRAIWQLKNKAFTIIELLVVISIIIILSAIILPNYRSGQQQFALQRSTSKLAQDIRRVQEMATSAKELDGVPPRYGIEASTGDPTHYILFADLNDNGKYEPADLEAIETITFEQGVMIDQLFVGDPFPLSSTTKIWITFKPPDPTTEIRNPAASEFSAVEIQLIGDSQTKTIKVNKVGRIEID